MENVNERTAVHFIGAVAAVVLVVTSEPLWNARTGRRPTRELRRQTAVWRTRLLVAQITAIVFGIADPRLRRAATVRTGKLVTGTGVVHYNDKRLDSPLSHDHPGEIVSHTSIILCP